jgi:hypothetical protein
MMEDLYKELSKEYLQLKPYRETYVEPRMKENIELVATKYGKFGTDTEWTDLRYDTIGTECSAFLGEGFFGNISPSSSPSFIYRFVDEKLNKSKQGPGILEKLTEYMMNVFNLSTYYAAGPEWFTVYNSLPVSCLDIQEDKSEGRIICSVDHPRAVYCKCNSQGIVDTVYIRRFYTPDQIAEIIGEDNLDGDIKSQLSQYSTKEFEFIECIKPRKTAKQGSPLATDWKYGRYLFRYGSSKGNILLESGFPTFPKGILRWGIRGNEAYGWTPTDESMPDIRTCNQMVRTALLAWNKQSDPAKWFPEESRNWNTNPGSTNYYSDPNRKPLFPDVGVYKFDKDAWELFHQRVRKSFKVDYFLMLMQIESQMTAREVVERKREGMSVTAATVGRTERTLDQIHERFLQIEWDSGRLQEAIPNIPPDLFGQGIKVDHVGPLSQQQKIIFAEQGIVNALNSCAPVFTLQPETRYKIKGSMIVDKLWSSYGAPSDLIRSDEEYQQVMQDMAKRAAEAEVSAQRQGMASKIDPNVKPQEGSPAEAMTKG